MNKTFILLFCLLLPQISYPQDIEPEVGSEVWLKKRNDEFTKSIEETINADPAEERQKVKNQNYSDAVNLFISNAWIDQTISLSGFEVDSDVGLTKPFAEQEISNFLSSLPINSYEVLDTYIGYQFIFIELQYNQIALDVIHHYPYVSSYETSQSYPSPTGLKSKDFDG